jgi:hypothetical protein
VQPIETGLTLPRALVVAVDRMINDVGCWPSFTVGGIRSARRLSGDKLPSAPMLCHGRR